ncbi:MAG: chemotaxis protein CheW [Roseiarcus sp.]|jgi:purine-binding chemotaxis protein CheW|uniref:chemotaxis protein CheW n=1 Tax=Roseiarcus sp. TaxID=1969460 RepID=UPI003C1DA036
MASAEESSRQVLMLGLAGEMFALDARQVREILDPVPVTRVPGAQPYVSSVLNVRGKVIPLADLRVRFGMPPASITPDSRFIVLEIDLAGEPTTIGIVADKVYEVTDLDTSTLQKAPPIGMRWRPEFIAAIAKWKDEFIIVPNMKQILN